MASHLRFACSPLCRGTAVPALLLCVGCFGPTPTTLELVNETGFAVDVRLFYDNDQELPKELIEADGTEVNVTVAAGATFTITRNCEDLQAVFIENAEMFVLPGISPDASTDVYRDGDDFGCGDTIRFTFTTNATNTDLDISFVNAR